MFPQFNKAPFWNQDPMDAAQHAWQTLASRLGTWYPADIREDEQNVYVEAELPGFRPEDVDVRLEKNELTITAKPTASEAESQAEFYLRERRGETYQRRFMLPGLVDQAKVEAKLEHGILHLTLPKASEERSHRINISGPGSKAGGGNKPGGGGGGGRS